MCATLVLAALVVEERPRAFFIRPLLAPIGTVAGTVLAVLPILVRGEHVSAERFTTLRPLTDMLSSRNELFWWQLASPLLLPLAVAGSIRLIKNGRALLTGALWSGTVLLLAAGFFILADVSDAIRYQTPAHTFLVILAGGVLAVRPGERPVSRPIGVAAMLAAVLSSLPGLASVRMPDLEGAAFRLVVEAERSLPQKLTVRVPAPRSLHVLSDFPDYVLRERGHELFVTKNPNARGPGECFVFMGPACYRFSQAGGPGEDPLKAPRFEGDPVRFECDSLVKGIDTTRPAPLARRVPVTWPDWQLHTTPAENPWIGFFPCR